MINGRNLTEKLNIGYKKRESHFCNSLILNEPPIRLERMTASLQEMRMNPQYIYKSSSYVSVTLTDLTFYSKNLT